MKLLSREAVPAFLVHSYDYAWFIGFAVPFVLYIALRKLMPSPTPTVAAGALSLTRMG